LAGRVAPLEDDPHAQPPVLHPVLELDQLFLQLQHLRFVESLLELARRRIALVVGAFRRFGPRPVRDRFRRGRVDYGRRSLIRLALILAVFLVLLSHRAPPWEQKASTDYTDFADF